MLTDHRDAVAALCKRASARRLDVFGSAVRPDFDTQRSDLDFVVVFDDLPPVEYWAPGSVLAFCLPFRRIDQSYFVMRN
jgi:predicted nucleotidyltransferase